jgi:hypothetical protein
VILIQDQFDGIAATSDVSATVLATPSFADFELVLLGKADSTPEQIQAWRSRRLEFAGALGLFEGAIHGAFLNQPGPERLAAIEAAFRQLVQSQLQPAPDTGDSVLFLERLWMESEDPS